MTTTHPQPRTWWGLRPWQRHSLVLAVAGVVYIAVGLTYLATPLTENRASSLELALVFFPLTVWGVVWIGVGLLALASTRWPPASSTWGYTALAAMAGGWGATYLLTIVFLGGPSSGFSGALVWFLVAFMWWAISGLMNPDDVPRDR